VRQEFSPKQAQDRQSKSDFELREISKEEYEKLKSLVLQENFLLASQIDDCQF
jgi:hypothetical protein